MKQITTVSLIFVFTVSNCNIFTPQSPQQLQPPPPNPAACHTDQDCTIVPKHSLCCEMEAIAILKTLEATHLSRECSYQPIVCAQVSYARFIARCVNSRCIVKERTDDGMR